MKLNEYGISEYAKNPDPLDALTVIGARMSHWKWRETKLLPSRARSGHKISC